jgi:shikimate dehydrogenase
MEQNNILFGLIGYPLEHSWSATYFNAKFDALGLPDHSYILIESDSARAVWFMLKSGMAFKGCNVTIPHKQEMLRLVDELDPAAAAIGAINTIDFRDGKGKGYNTDYIGFRDSLAEWLGDTKPQSALVLGNGGSAKAVIYVLTQLGCRITIVSRTPTESNEIAWDQIDQKIIQNHQLIVNTTPIGMFPDICEAPLLPFSCLTPDHWCFDLVYNPAETVFLRLAARAGAHTQGGLDMLHRQAEAAWEIWNRAESLSV